MYADSLGFLGPPGTPPKFENPPNVQVMGVTCVPPFVHKYERALKEVRLFASTALQNKGTYLIRSVRNVVNPPEGGNLGLVLGMQHAPEGVATLEHLRSLKREGLCVLGLAYNTGNSYGCGCMVEDTGLTDEGKSLIKNMADVGLVLDLSHVGDKTAMDALLLIDEKGLPIVPMASHSACSSVYNHPRNISDELMAYITMLSGYIGIPAISFFLCEEGKDSVDAMVRHIAHAIDVCNEDTVGVGSDCPWTNTTLSVAKQDFERMRKMLKTNGKLGEYFPDRPEQLIRDGSDLMGFIYHALDVSCLDSQFVEEVCEENFIEYLKRALPR